MNVSRLKRLMALLESDATKDGGVKFDMNAWASPSESDDKRPYTEDTTAIPVDCGTKACAFGLAAISGIFADEGLGWRIQTGFESSVGMLSPTFQNFTDYDAARVFFRLTSRQTYFLFDPAEYSVLTGAKAELEVVARIREMLDYHNSNPHEDPFDPPLHDDSGTDDLALPEEY